MIYHVVYLCKNCGKTYHVAWEFPVEVGVPHQFPPLPQCRTNDYYSGKIPCGNRTPDLEVVRVNIAP